MKVSCAVTPEGNVYLFYRTSSDFPRAMKPVVPFLLAGHADVFVGRIDGDSKLALRLGPIAGDAEIRLLELIERYLSPHAAPSAE